MHQTYIPYSRADIERLATDVLPATLKPRFSYFAKLLRSWFHHALHDALEAQKADLAALLDGQATEADARRFAASLESAALTANFQPISEAMLTEALAEESTFRIRLAVDFSQFEEVVFYGRGAEQKEAEVPRLLGLRTTRVTFTNFRTVLVYMRFRNEKALDAQLRGQTVLKLFANVPQADLEMLFPNSQIRMRLSDKLVIGVPAFVSGLIVLFTKLGSALLLTGGLLAFWVGLSDREVAIDQTALVGLMTAAGALGGYLWKQFSNFKNRKIRFMKALTERLYFKNLDNNAGVLTALADFAEEAECKETLLAYAVLLRDGALTRQGIRQAVERLVDHPEFCFDVEDACDKLLELGLAEQRDEALHPQPLDDAIAQIDARWDALFSAP